MYQNHLNVAFASSGEFFRLSWGNPRDTPEKTDLQKSKDGYDHLLHHHQGPTIDTFFPSLRYPAEHFSEFFFQRIYENLLCHNPISIIAIKAVSFRYADGNPVGGPVTGPFEANRLHEGFQKYWTISVASLPVIRKVSGDTA